MTEEIENPMIDLLALNATYGLDVGERNELDRLLAEAGMQYDHSFDIAASAIALAEMRIDEPLPEHLFAKITASGNDFINSLGIQPHAAAEPVEEKADDEYQKVFTLDPPRRSWNWLGWAVAAAACVALAVNVWFTRLGPKEVADLPKPPTTEQKLSVEQEYAKFISEPTDAITAKWTAPPTPPAELKDVAGDVTWSDEKQKGFMRFKGLPVNDKSKSTYQLWIFDKTQDAKTPIDGGTFDVDRNGEVIIAINAKLKAQGPALFAITIEKPGGVVVSKRDKIAALAKVETQSKSNT